MEQDPRVERSRRVIMEATLDELSESGYGALSIESIAKRAGVGKATVYRHWDNKLDLVADSLATLKQIPFPPVSGTVRERLQALLEAVTEAVSGAKWAACIPALVSAADRDAGCRAFLDDFTSTRHAVFVDLVQEGIDNGEFPADLDARLTADLLVGPIFYRRLMSPEPMEASAVARLIDQVLPPP